MDSENTAEKEHFTIRSKEIKKKNKKTQAPRSLSYISKIFKNVCLKQTVRIFSLVGELTRLWSSCSL